MSPAPGRRRSARAALALLGSAWLWAAPLWTVEESLIPPDLQASLLLTVLSFDRELALQAGAELVVGVVIQRKYRPSLESGEDMLAAFAASPAASLLGVPLRVVAVDLGPDSDIEAELKRLEVDALYVTPLRAVAIQRIATATRARHVRSLTAVPGAVADGLAVGLGTRDQRPEILVNLPAAAAEGAEFTAQLLRIARIVS